MTSPLQRWKQRWPLVGLLLPVTFYLGAFFCVPLGIMIIYSFLAPGLYGGVEWSFYPHSFGRVLGFADPAFEEFDPIYLTILLRSLKLASITVILTLLICYPAAWWVSRLPDRWKAFCLFLVTLPFFTSLIVRLYAWVLILRPTGFVNHVLEGFGVIAHPLQMIFTQPAVVVGLVYVLVPFMFLPLYASIEKLDRSLLEASQDLGASRLQTFRRVVLPLTLPGVIGGSIIVFIPSVGNFIVPSVLGGAKAPMLGSLIEQQFLYARNWPFGAALAMLIMAIVLIMLLVYVVVDTRDDAAARAIRA